MGRGPDGRFLATGLFVHPEHHGQKAPPLNPKCTSHPSHTGCPPAQRRKTRPAGRGRGGRASARPVRRAEPRCQRPTRAPASATARPRAPGARGGSVPEACGERPASTGSTGGPGHPRTCVLGFQEGVAAGGGVQDDAEKEGGVAADALVERQLQHACVEPGCGGRIRAGRLLRTRPWPCAHDHTTGPSPSPCVWVLPGATCNLPCCSPSPG